MENHSNYSSKENKVDITKLYQLHQEWIKHCLNDWITDRSKYAYDKRRLIMFNIQQNWGDEDLSYWLLKGALLSNTSLIHATLFCTDLSYSEMDNCIIENTDLAGSVLEHVIAVNTKFRGSRFTNAKIRSCNFSFTDFTHYQSKVTTKNYESIQIIKTEGLFDSLFADCNLTGARLPEGIAKFEMLGTINESTKSNRRLLWQLLVFSAAIPLALVTKQNLNVQAIGLKFPLEWVAISGFLFLFYWYFHVQMNLQRHWELLDHLPSKFPDGLSCEKRIQPWFVNLFLLKHRTFLKDELPQWYKLQYGVISFVVWWVAPISLLFINGFSSSWLNEWGLLGLNLLCGASAIIGYQSRKAAITTLHGDIAPFLDYPHNFWKAMREKKSATEQPQGYWKQFWKFTWKQRWTCTWPVWEAIGAIICLYLFTWFEHELGHHELMWFLKQLI